MNEGRVTRVGKLFWLVLIRGKYIVVKVIKMVLSYGSIGRSATFLLVFEDSLSGSRGLGGKGEPASPWEGLARGAGEGRVRGERALVLNDGEMHCRRDGERRCSKNGAGRKVSAGG